MFGGQPIIILEKGTRRESGEDAIKDNINAANAIADVIRTTIGPKGMDKMLVDSLGDVIITNDGATILKNIDIEHPAAKMIVEIAETQDDECGDGTSSAVILAGELLKRSEQMIGRLHPSIITRGYKLATEKSIEILDEMKHEFDINDKTVLKNIAKTAMTGKSIEMNRDQIADIAVYAVSLISEKTKNGVAADVDNIKIVKQVGGNVGDSKLVKGIIIDKERCTEGMPKEVKKAKIALINSPIEVRKTEVKSSIDIKNPKQLQEFLDEEESTIRKMVDMIVNSGANVLFSQKEVNDLAKHYLTKNNIFAIEDVSSNDMKKLEKSTGGKLVNNLRDLKKADLGKADLIEEKIISGSRYSFITGTKKSRSVSILLRGGTKHIVDEVERAIEDAVKVVSIGIEDGAILPGGGAVEIEISKKLRDYAGTIEGREQIAVEAFAEGLKIIPRSIAENAGLDAIDIILELNTAHEEPKQNSYGFDVETQELTDMIEAGIIEPYRVKLQAIRSATEAVNMIMRIDDLIASRGFGSSKTSEEDYDEDIY